MGLSPEERRRIYEEEKTRLEAQDKIKVEKTKKDAQSTRNVVIGGCITVFIIVVILGIAFGTCGDGSESPTSPTTYLVKYEVTGSADSVSLTYQNDSGGTSQTSNSYLPWTYTFLAQKGDFVYISAQNNGEYGSVTVRIYLDSTQVKTSTSSGAYVIATASGMV